ncbi:hypothetical protein BJ912DRAFT_978148 [Pholiota molesta]|nr:hypothetical protein BJ912DRAFT_978148 [Pholiota molesta]
MISYDTRVLNPLDDPNVPEGRSKSNAPPIYTEISDRECVSRRPSSPPELVPSTRNVHDYVELPRNTNAINLILVNRGSVARDHLASERTFLAYVRTSLGLSSAGVALMQFLRLGNSTQSYAAPIGAVAVLTGLLTLLFGQNAKIFLIQKTLVDGQFPPSVWETA